MRMRALKFYLQLEQDCNIYEFTADEITYTRLEQDQVSWTSSIGKERVAKISPLFEDLLAVDRCWEGESYFSRLWPRDYHSSTSSWLYTNVYRSALIKFSCILSINKEFQMTWRWREICLRCEELGWGC